MKWLARTSLRLASTLASHEVASIREFGPNVAHELTRRGYTVVDDALSPGVVRALRAEVEGLHQRGLLSANETHFAGGEKQARLAKVGVTECELHLLHTAHREQTPGLCALESDSTLLTLLSVYEPAITLRKQALKAQRNAGDGGCFPLHVDSAAGVDQRLVTGIVYLNEEWAGGQLRLYPFPHAPVDVEPIAGRIVLLAARTLVHRVLPAWKCRYALTLWLSGSVRTKAPNVLPADADAADVLFDALLEPDIRPHTMRLALAEEWDASLRDAHTAADAEMAIAKHMGDRKKIAERLPDIVSRTLPEDDMRRAKVREICADVISDPTTILQVLAKRASRREHCWL